MIDVRVWRTMHMHVWNIWYHAIDGMDMNMHAYLPAEAEATNGNNEYKKRML